MIRTIAAALAAFALTAFSARAADEAKHEKAEAKHEKAEKKAEKKEKKAEKAEEKKADKAAAPKAEEKK